MDSGWAIVIGAGIALIGSAVVPWARDAVTERSRRRRERHDAIGAALLALHAALGDLLAARIATPSGPDGEGMTRDNLAHIEALTGVRPNVMRATGFDAEPSLARLALLVRTDQAEVVVIARQAFAAIGRVAWSIEGVIGTEDGYAIWRGFLDTASAWHRGEIRDKSIAADYNDRVTAPLGRLLAS